MITSDFNITLKVFCQALSWELNSPLPKSTEYLSVYWHHLLPTLATVKLFFSDNAAWIKQVNYLSDRMLLKDC